MKRSYMACLLAPLWVPAAVVLFAASMFPYPGEGRWIAISTAVAAGFSYFGAAMLGAPAARFLCSRGLTGPWAAVVLGLVVGEVTWALFGLCFGLALGEGLQGFVDFIGDAIGGDFFGPLIPAALGALVALTFWAIARPDREGRSGPRPFDPPPSAQGAPQPQ